MGRSIRVERGVNTIGHASGSRVAVGTRIAPRPPHRSRRALLTHRAPPSGSGVEAVAGQRVQHLDWREEAVDEPDELELALSTLQTDERFLYRGMESSSRYRQACMGYYAREKNLDKETSVYAEQYIGK